jgi:hypothetical protein
LYFPKTDGRQIESSQPLDGRAVLIRRDAVRTNGHQAREAGKLLEIDVLRQKYLKGSLAGFAKA